MKGEMCRILEQERKQKFCRQKNYIGWKFNLGTVKQSIKKASLDSTLVVNSSVQRYYAGCYSSANAIYLAICLNQGYMFKDITSAALDPGRRTSSTLKVRWVDKKLPNFLYLARCGKYRKIKEKFRFYLVLEILCQICTVLPWRRL